MAGVTTVLAVDDSETVRRSLALRLSNHGFDVTTSASAEEALALLDTREFDIVLLDLRMPATSGLDALRAIRRRRTAAELPVIMLTVSDDTPDIVQAYELGANDYVVKPGELPVLVARINTQTSLRHAHHALREAHRELERTLVHKSVALEESQSNLETAEQRKEQAESELRASEQRYRVFYDENPSMLFTLSVDGIILAANHLGASQLGYRRSDLIGTSMLSLYHPDDRAAARRYLKGVVELPERLHRWELRKLHRAGDAGWFRETARLVEEGGAHGSILVVCEDINETYRLSERLSFHERYDALTGLLNRRSFTEQIEGALADARRSDIEHALVFLDLDQFKVVNDTCGHAAGDELLVRIAEILAKSVRRRDTLARMGDDEFALLIENCGVEPAATVANALRDAIAAHHLQWAGRTLSVSASIAIVPITRASRDTAALLAMADAACYAAKDAGRNRVHVYAEGDLKLLARFGEMHWVSRIKDALAAGRFHLAVQPITPVAPRGAARLHGAHFELLLRMRDEEGREIAPNEFLPAAERYSLASQLDRWVVENALAWLQTDRAALDAMYLCAINLSGQSLGDEALLGYLLGELDKRLIPASKLCFEITETAAINDYATALRFISILKDRGCRFALDDFGSGLSSFGYLKTLPVDFLKIDGVFVKDIVSNPLDLALVRSINDIGHVLGKQTIAEFVETESILAELRGVGVDYAQGYGIGRPAPIGPFGKRP